MRDNKTVNFNQPFTFEEAYNYLLHVDPTVTFKSFYNNKKYVSNMIYMRENNNLLELWFYEPYPVPMAFNVLDHIDFIDCLQNKIYYIDQHNNLISRIILSEANGVIDYLKTFTENEFEKGNRYISNYIHDTLGNQTGMRLVKDLRSNKIESYVLDKENDLYEPVRPTNFYRIYDIKKYNFTYRLPDICK